MILQKSAIIISFAVIALSIWDAMFVEANSDRLLKSSKVGKKVKGAKKSKKSKKEVDFPNSSDNEVDFPNSSDNEDIPVGQVAAELLEWKKGKHEQHCTIDLFKGSYRYISPCGKGLLGTIACSDEDDDTCFYSERVIAPDACPESGVLNDEEEEDQCTVGGSFKQSENIKYNAETDSCELAYFDFSEDRCDLYLGEGGLGMKAVINFSSRQKMLLWFTSDSGKTFYNVEEPRIAVVSSDVDQYDASQALSSDMIHAAKQRRQSVCKECEENQNVFLLEVDDDDDENWKKVNNAIDKLGGIADLVQTFPNSSSSPAEITNFFGNVANEIGTFFPAFGALGSVIGIFAGFLGGPVPEDPLKLALDQINVRFDEIESKLDNILNKFDKGIKEMKKLMCDRDFDSKVFTYIVSFENKYERFEDAEPRFKKNEMDSLMTHCINHAPITIMDSFAFYITGSSRAKCFKVITDDANYRVGYFRTEFVGYVLNLMMKGARYESICQGLRDPDAFSDNTGDTGDEKMFTEPFREMHKALKAAEDEMYDAVPGTSWGLTLTSDDQYKDLKPRQLYKALKDDFFPDYKYGIIEYTGTVNSDAVARFDTVNDGKPYGSIVVGQNIVFYITRDFTGILNPLSPWENTKYGKKCSHGLDNMCLWWCNTWSGCNKATEQIINTGRNNSPLRWEYRERGVVLIRTEYNNKKCSFLKYCIAFWCPCGVWTWNDTGIGDNIVAEYGDPIYQKFTTGWEGNGQGEDDVRAKYTVVGLGNWPPSEPLSTLAENNFNDRGDTTLSVSSSYSYTLANGYQVQLTGWKYTRNFAYGFLLVGQPHKPTAVVSGLVPSGIYAFKVYQTFDSKHDIYGGTNPLSVNGISRGSTTSSGSMEATAKGTATADEQGKITFTFQRRQTAYVVLSGLAIGALL